MSRLIYGYLRDIERFGNVRCAGWPLWAWALFLPVFLMVGYMLYLAFKRNRSPQ